MSQANRPLARRAVRFPTLAAALQAAAPLADRVPADALAIRVGVARARLADAAALESLARGGEVALEVAAAPDPVADLIEASRRAGGQPVLADDADAASTLAGEASRESFPASDPPAWTATGTGGT